MKRVAIVIAVLGLAGCAVHTYRPPAGKTAYGTYPFKQVLPNANPPMTLEGTVLLLPDTVMMTLGGKSCSYFAQTRSTGSYNYGCGDISFSFSKANPLRSNVYRVPTVVWQMRQVCTSYRTNPRTQAEECARYGQERVESRQVLSGSLTFLER